MPMNPSCDDPLKNGFLEIVQEPQNVEIISCSVISPSNVSQEVPYDSCIESKESLSDQMDLKSGRFTVSKDGFYLITFTGTLLSNDGTRIWINLNMKDSKNGEGISFIYKLTK